MACAGVQTREQQRRGRDVRVLHDERFRADDGLAGLPREMQDAGNAHTGFGPGGIDGDYAFENGAGLIERPFIETSMGEEEQQRNVVGRNGDSLAKRV